MFSVFQSRPIHSTSLLYANLNNIANSIRGYIHVGEIATSVAIDVELLNQVTHLTHMQEFTLIDINHYINRQLMRARTPNEFNLLIHNKVIHCFFLPNREQTGTHNYENWIYRLEGQGEAHEPPQTLPKSEYHPAPQSDISSSSYFTSLPNQQEHNVDYELNALRREVITLFQALQDQIDKMDEQMDYLFQEIYSLRRVMGPTASYRGT